MTLLEEIKRLVTTLDRGASCEGKVAYMSLRQATRQAYALSEQREEEFEPYLCRHCGDYHVGHS